MNIVVSFLMSFIISTGGTFFILNNNNNIEPEVLAVYVEQQPEVTIEPTSTPTPTPTPTPSPTATPTPSPSPTVKPTSTPTLTPTPTPEAQPTSTPDVWSPPDMEHWFAQYAGQYGIDQNLLERIANCESHFNPNARNRDYVGMFQFATQTWVNYRSQMGLDTNPDLRTNIEESIRTGAFLISKRGSSPWPSCV